MPSIHLITFAADKEGTIRYRLAAEYMKDAAEEFELFDSISIREKEDLEADDEFLEHIPFILENPRGFGYWIWKPYIILKKLRELPEGDILLYCDACTLLKKEGKSRFQEYIELLQKNPEQCLFVKNALPIGMWCKMDVLSELSPVDISNEADILSGVIFVAATPENIRFFEIFYRTACNYHMIDDSPSQRPNLEIFKEHRHDQSLFTILAYKHRPLSVVRALQVEELMSTEKDKRTGAPILIQANLY